MRIFSVILLAAWMLCGTALAQTGYTPLGKTLLVGTNGVVTQPEGFWTNNVLGVGDITVDTDAQGRMRISLTVDTNTALSVYWDAILDIPDVLADIPALTNVLAKALAAFDWGAHAEAGYIGTSTTFSAWTDTGGTYTTAQVVATSPLLTNGLAAITYSAGGGMFAVAEMAAALDGTWTNATATANPVYVRVRLTDDMPVFGDSTVTNIVATSWTHPDRYGVTNDTAGQRVLVDTPTEDRHTANKAYVDAQAAVADASGWSAWPATQTVRVNGQLLQLGPVWSVLETNNTLTVSQGGQPVLSFYYAFAAAQIAAVSITGDVATASVATNGITARPLLQWSASITEPAWQTLTPTSETYPGLNTNGHYEIVATLPSSTSGFLRSVQEDTPIAEVRGHLLPSASGIYDLGSEAKPWASLYLAGNALYSGTTNLASLILSAIQPADTNGWNVAAFQEWVLRSETNAWETGSHAGFAVENEDATFRTNTATAYTYPLNKRSIPTTESITNTAWVISSTGAFERVYGFADGITNANFTLPGPGVGYRSEVDATFTNWTAAAVSWTNNTPVPVFIPAAPTSNYARVIFQWDGTNSITVLNITPGE